jgi:hypothetical protein
MRAIKGVVTAPQGLIGVDAGTLIGVDAGTLIGVDAGTLLPAGRLRLAQSGLVPLAGAAVVLAGPDGAPVKPLVQATTDAQGRFTLRARVRGGVLLALGRGPGGGSVRLSAIPSAFQSGEQVSISPATTAVTAALMAEVRGGIRNFSAMAAREYAAACAAMEPHVSGMALEKMGDEAAMAKAFLGMVAGNETHRAGFERMKASLTETMYEEAVEEPPRASVQPVAPGTVGPGAALVGVPVEATPGTAPAASKPEPSLQPPFEPTPAQAPAPTATPVPTPAAVSPTPAPIPTPRSFAVPAKMASCDAWYDTGLAVKAGDVLEIKASGTWSPNGVASLGPRGDSTKPLTPIWGECWGPMVNSPLGALVMKVGQTPQLVGESLGPTPGFTGALKFKMNDNDFSDNSGSLTVTVKINGQ